MQHVVSVTAAQDCPRPCAQLHNVSIFTEIVTCNSSEVEWWSKSRQRTRWNFIAWPCVGASTQSKGAVIRAIFSCNLSRNNVAVASWDCLLRVLPPSRATNFHVTESRCRFYFLQHKNLLREKVVIRATNNVNLQRQHCCATSCTKMLPVLPRLNCLQYF